MNTRSVTRAGYAGAVHIEKRWNRRPSPIPPLPWAAKLMSIMRRPLYPVRKSYLLSYRVPEILTDANFTVTANLEKQEILIYGQVF